MKERLIQIAKDLSIEYIGVVSPEIDLNLKKILKNRLNNKHVTGLEEMDIELRINASENMENCKSIIVCLFPYYVGDKNTNISNYTYSHDYHKIIKCKLDKIGEKLGNCIQNFKYKSFTDTGPLVDRFLAYKAGLGFFGLSNNFINDKYGTYTFIGYIINNYEFKKDKPLDKECLKCKKCIKACPGEALMENFQMDPRKCVSYLTQKKGELTETEIMKVKKANKVYGCDICQQVCPHNKNVDYTCIDDFYNDLIFELKEEEIESMSNKGFKRVYGDRAFSWRGRKIIDRNFKYIKKE